MFAITDGIFPLPVMLYLMHRSRTLTAAAIAGAKSGQALSRKCTGLTRVHTSRKIWTAATCSHPDLATALSKCFPASATPATGDQTKSSKHFFTIVLASRSYPGSDLLSLPAQIPKHISSTSHVLGAVVDRVPTTSGHGVSTLTLAPDSSTQSSSNQHQHNLISSCEAFYLSGAESRRKRLKEKSVGKWARSQDIEERSLDTADAWSAFKSISIGRNQVQVPEAALPFKNTASSSASTSLAGPSSSTAHSQDILMISDLEVHQFLEALDVANPGASKLGLVATSTPFITGKPVTMFFDGKIVQDGVLGVSIVMKDHSATSESRSKEIAKALVKYPSMAPLGPAMQITRCRGNIILELDESNATRLLLERLQATTLTKDKEYFLATGEPTNSNSSEEVKNVDMNEATVYKITGGDPSKGNMAVDTVHDLNVGQWVQFIHHDKAQDHGHFDVSTDSNDFVRFTTSDPNNTIEEQSGTQLQEHDDEVSIRKVFGGSSENGFIVGQPNKQTWVCTVTDSVVKQTF